MSRGYTPARAYTILNHAMTLGLDSWMTNLCVPTSADFYFQSKTPHSRASSTTSAYSRHNSTSNYAQSVGPGHRPQTSMGNNFGQSVNGHGRPRANTSRRPATAMGNRGPDPDTTTGSQCTASPVNPPISSQPASSNYLKSGALLNKRLRPSASTPSLIPTASPARRASSTQSSVQSSSSRQSSLNSLVSRFGNMTISEEGEGNDERSNHQNGGQVNSKGNANKAAGADHQPGPRLSDTTVRPERRVKAVGH